MNDIVTLNSTYCKKENCSIASLFLPFYQKKFEIVIFSITTNVDNKTVFLKNNKCGFH